MPSFSVASPLAAVFFFVCFSLDFMPNLWYNIGVRGVPLFLSFVLFHWGFCHACSCSWLSLFLPLFCPVGSVFVWLPCLFGSAFSGRSGLGLWASFACWFCGCPVCSCRWCSCPCVLRRVLLLCLWLFASGLISARVLFCPGRLCPGLFLWFALVVAFCSMLLFATVVFGFSLAG